MTNDDDVLLNRPFTPRPFFIPGTEDADTAEAIYAGTRKNLHEETVPDRRIQRLDYEHNGRKLRAEVGEPDEGGEGTVIAIFGPSSPRNLYYVTTRERGVLRGDPIVVGTGKVRKVYEFLDN